MSALTREQFGQLIGQVRVNGSCPDAPLLEVYDAFCTRLAHASKRTLVDSMIIEKLEQQLADRDSTIERLMAEMGYHDAKDVIEQLTQHLADRDARIAKLQEALAWVLNLHRGVSKFAGDGFHHGVTGQEWQEALAAGKQALAQEEP